MRETVEMAARMKAVSAVIVTAEGGLTDSLVSLGDEQPARTCRADIVGLQLLLAADWRVALVSEQPAADRQRLLELAPGLELLPNRGAAVRGWVELAQVAYLGSELHDLPSMLACELSVAPRDAALLVRKRSDLILESAGGRGALRELAERLLSVQDQICPALKAWYRRHGGEVGEEWLTEIEAEVGSATSKIGFRP